MNQEYSKYEVLEITKERKAFKFLIEKKYWQSFTVENEKFSVLEAGLQIYFEELPKGINAYNQVPWSIKWERNSFREDGEVKYAHSGMLQVDEKYRNIGLGSYLLDSLTQWAQEKFNESVVNIHIVHKDYTDVEESLIQHFYGKRNLNNGVKISEVRTFLMESKDVRIISAIDYLLELFKENMRLDNDIRSIVRNESVLRKTD